MRIRAQDCIGRGFRYCFPMKNDAENWKTGQDPEGDGDRVSLPELLAAYDRLIETEAEAIEDGDRIEAVLSRRMRRRVVQGIFDEAARLGLPLCRTGREGEDMEMVRRLTSPGGFRLQ
jgi:hypothetical protein